MDYKEKYEQALERASKLRVQNPFDTVGQMVEHIFPDLQENEDERIRKAIHIYLDWLDGHKDYAPKGSYTIKDMITWLDKQGGNKPTDKIEPKFKVGDWVVLNNTVAQILNKQEHGFAGLDTNGKDFFCNYGHTDSMRLWTIRDAIDGDVLAAKDGRSFIFTGKFDAQDYEPTAYCGINSDDKFIIGRGSHWTFKNGVAPATKKQRDLLFSKMKEAGYEWNSEKKELKKIGVKTLDADKVIKWLKNTIKKKAENYGVYKETRLVLPYNSIEDLINDFKEDFGL